MLLDADLYRGSCALLLNAKSGAGLRTALETPQRIDELFIERSAQPVTERLHVLSGEENLLEQVNYEPGAAGAADRNAAAALQLRRHRRAVHRAADCIAIC